MLPSAVPDSAATYMPSRSVGHMHLHSHFRKLQGEPGGEKGGTLKITPEEPPGSVAGLRGPSLQTEGKWLTSFDTQLSSTSGQMSAADPGNEQFILW